MTFENKQCYVLRVPVQIAGKLKSDSVKFTFLNNYNNYLYIYVHLCTFMYHLFIHMILSCILPEMNQ